MRAWPSPDLPALPIEGPPVTVHDSATGTRQVTVPGDTARLYVCGITPYDATHLGHAATYVAFDLLNRAWRNAGHAVDYVQNVTDVDDPLLERATRTGVDWRELAERETQLFREDMAALRVLPPDHYLGAVETIPLVITFIQQLLAAGAVYEVEGDLYFSVAADPSFGGVSGWSREQMLEIFAERGGDPARSGKKDPLDCLVWMAQRPGDPAWDSPWGQGRPGWHIECTAIAERHLGAAFDVQGGGRDLVFPHHEMCAAEGQVARPHVPFAQAYVHAGLVGYDGEKMSKSRGNLVFVSHLRRDGTDPAAIRLALLRHHYRSDWEWASADLADAEVMLQRWRDAVALGAGAPAGPTVAAVLAAISDDLDAPRAVAIVDDWARDTLSRRYDDSSAPGLVTAVVDAALGIAI